jgi:transcriptional regulator with XRE-family HTH domain
MTSISQIRAARSLLGWTQSWLAHAAGLSDPTVKRFETRRGAIKSEAAEAKMVAALEAAGIEFIAENCGGPGVRLGKGVLLWLTEVEANRLAALRREGVIRMAKAQD